MNIIRDNFLHIVGREPTASETAYISGLIKTNNVREDDAFLSVIVIDYAHNVANVEAIKNGKETIKSTLEDGYKNYLTAISKAKKSAEDTARASIETVAVEVLRELKTESVKVISETASKAIDTKNNWSMFWVLIGAVMIYSIGMFNGYILSINKLPNWINSDSTFFVFLSSITKAPALSIVLLYGAFISFLQAYKTDSNAKYFLSFLLIALGLLNSFAL